MSSGTSSHGHQDRPERGAAVDNAGQLPECQSRPMCRSQIAQGLGQGSSLFATFALVNHGATVHGFHSTSALFGQVGIPTGCTNKWRSDPTAVGNGQTVTETIQGKKAPAPESQHRKLKLPSRRLSFYLVFTAYPALRVLGTVKASNGSTVSRTLHSPSAFTQYLTP